MISVHVDYQRRGREKFDNYVWKKVWEKIFARVMVLKGRGFERNCSMEQGSGQGWEEEEEDYQ